MNIQGFNLVLRSFSPCRKVVLDGKTFAPFGMLPHAVEPVKVDPAPVGPRWTWSSSL